MNKRNQAKYNKRLKSNMLEINIAKLDDEEFAFFKKNLEFGKTLFGFTRSVAYKIVEMARDMAQFYNSSMQEAIEKLGSSKRLG